MCFRVCDCSRMGIQGGYGGIHGQVRKSSRGKEQEVGEDAQRVSHLYSPRLWPSTESWSIYWWDHAYVSWKVSLFVCRCVEFWLFRFESLNFSVFMIGGCNQSHFRVLIVWLSTLTNTECHLPLLRTQCAITSTLKSPIRMVRLLHCSDNLFILYWCDIIVFECYFCWSE